MSDCIVIGGGIIGLTSAYELACRGARVTLIDQQKTGQEASWAGAGMLPPGDAQTDSRDLKALTRFTHSRWPTLTHQLFESTGIDNGFLPCGGLRILADDASTDTREDFVNEVSSWREQGVTASELTAHDHLRFEPKLTDQIATSLYLPDFCQVRNPWHLRALRVACENRGVDFREGESVRVIERYGTAQVEIRTERNRFQATHCVVAAGAWSAQLLSESNFPIPVEPVRGQIVLLKTDHPVLSHVVECGKRYLVPRGDGRLLVGATEEWAGFEKRNTAVGVRSLLDFAISLVPSLKDATIEKCWSGLRPCCSDRLPIIGPIPDRENIIIATGHYRFGLHLSAATGHVVGQLITGEPLDVRMDDFACSRFSPILDSR